MILHVATFDQLEPATLYGVLRLRTEVFVVEQRCPYPELDGRDLEPGTRHLWLAPAQEPDNPQAYLRILDEPHGAARIGRVCTRAKSRGAGLSAKLLTAALDLLRQESRDSGHDRAVVLDAQSYLVDFYAGLGFRASGPEFVEDGIPHTPMRLS